MLRGNDMSRQEITSHKQLPESQSLELYNYFFHLSQQALIITNQHFEIVQLNNRACHILQLNMDSCLNKPLFELLSRVSVDDLQEHVERIEAYGDCSDEWLVQDGAGQSIVVKYDVTYKGQHFFITMTDVTEYKKYEHDYSISTKIFEDIFAKVTDGLILFDQKGRIIDVNGAFLSIINKKKRELVGKEFYMLLSEQGKKKWLPDWEVLLEKGNLSTIVDLEMNGQKHYFKCCAYTNIYQYHFIGVFKDITEKKVIEKRLQKSENMFELIFEQANDGIILCDENGIIEANDVACRIFEMNRIDLVGKNLFDFVEKRDEKFMNVLSELEQIGAVREELLFAMPNRQKKLLEFTSKRVEDTNTTVTIIRNVSERYEMEQKLRQSEKHFREIFEGLNVGLLLWRKDKVFDINKAGAKILLRSKKKIREMGLRQLWNTISDDHVGLEKMLKKLQTKKMVEETLGVKFRNGTTKYIKFSTKKHAVNDLNLTIFRDVTEDLEMEEKLRKSDTLSVVGELAAGIAHEIRNPMTALKGFIQLLQGSVKEDFSNYFTIITSELKRIDSIITEFLMLAKPQVIQYEEKDINHIVQETVDLLRAESVLYDVVLETSYFNDRLYLYCEPNQLKQVFINIMKNALESMSHGGKVTIKTDLVEEEYIKVSIQDEGVGIPEEKLKKLGEPFYTTKDRGTGLGLMISFKIIEEHKGRIEVESELGVGTTFSVYLPSRMQNESWSS